jgi:hypothetical protein
MKLVLSVLALLLSQLVMAEDIFVLKKTSNPKNVLHFSAETKDCKLTKPSVKAYWVMGEEDGQKEDLLKIERPFFQPRITYISETETDFSFGALDKMGERLPDKTIRVRVEKCQAKAFIDIKGREIQLKEIFVKMGLLLNVKELTVKGIGADGSAINYYFDN